MKKRMINVFIVTILTSTLFACSTGKIIKTPIETTAIDESKMKTKYYEIGGEFCEKLHDYSQYVKLGQYSGFDVKVASAKVTDKQIQEVIDGEIKRGTTYKQIKEGVVKETDTINLDYIGKLDGVVLRGMSAMGYRYKINDGFIDSLNDQFPGLEIGKTYDLNVTYPEVYPSNPALAGKETVFTVKVNYVEGEAIVPEWNDEYVKNITQGKYTTTEAYEEYIREELKDYNYEKQENEFAQNTWKLILENCKILGYPEEQLKQSTDDYFKYYTEKFKESASSYGVSYEECLKANGYEDEQALKEKCKKTAQSELEYIMIGIEIAKKEQLAVTLDIFTNLIQEYSKEHGFDDISKLVDQYGIDYIMETFVFDGVCLWLYDNNNMVVSNV